MTKSTIIAFLLVSLAIASCGRKGPLEPPPPRPELTPGREQPAG